jgi:hypothetical protein
MVFIISLIITVTSFTFILYIERKIYNPNGSSEVYVAKINKIEKGYVINKKNFDHLFKLEERRNEQIVPNPIKNKEDLMDTVINENIYKNEVVSSSMLSKVDDELDEIDDKREISIKGSDISDVVGGELREGDKIDIMMTYSSSNKVITETKIKSAYVSKTYSSDGSIITRDSQDKPATTINVIVSANDADVLENAINVGKIKVDKVLDDTESGDIKVENDKH